VTDADVHCQGGCKRRSNASRARARVTRTRREAVDVDGHQGQGPGSQGELRSSLRSSLRLRCARLHLPSMMKMLVAGAANAPSDPPPGSEPDPIRRSQAVVTCISTNKLLRTATRARRDGPTCAALQPVSGCLYRVSVGGPLTHALYVSPREAPGRTGPSIAVAVVPEPEPNYKHAISALSFEERTRS
jgi:hypothetical protein